MIIIPRRKKPSNYRKVTKTNKEVVGADFKVDTIIFFNEKTIEKCTKDSLRGVPTVTANHEYKPEKSYKFSVTVHLSAEEYKNNRTINLDEYVCNKAKELCTYKELLEEVLSKVSEGREYEAETFISKEAESKVLHTIKTEHMEYVPVW